MDISDILENAAYAGEIMLENGAETYRVEDTMVRLLKNHNLDEVDAFVTPTCILATIRGKDGIIQSIVRRVKVRGVHLGKVSAINDLSRSFALGKISDANIRDRLKEIDVSLPYPTILKMIAAAASCFCFTYMFGGTITSAAVSCLVGFIIYFIYIFLNTHNLSNVLTNIICGGAISSLTLILVNLLSGTSADYSSVVIGAIMPLVPGVGITNAIRDVLEGDFLSGTCRFADALIIAVCVAVGVGSVLRVWIFAFGGIYL